MPETIDVERLMQNVRDRIERASTYDPATAQASLPVEPTPPGLEAIARANRSLRLRKSLVGEIPPAPPTLRARVSGVLVKVIKASLFWFTGRLDDFHSSIVEANELQSAALSSLAWSGQQSRQLAEHAIRRMEELSAGLAAEMAARERAEQVLRAEIAERQPLSATVEEGASRLRTLETGYRSLE